MTDKATTVTYQPRPPFPRIRVASARAGSAQASILHAVDGQDRLTTNLEVHDAVTPQTFAAYELTEGRLSATLPPLSWTVFEIEAAREQ